MISAFLWGSLIFQEKISDLPMAIFANMFLVIGVYCVSTSQAKESVSQDGTYKYSFSHRFGYDVHINRYVYIYMHTYPFQCPIVVSLRLLHSDFL
jgi:hypothetical protein